MFRKITSKSTGGRGDPPLQTGRRVVAPYARITVCPFRNSKQTLRREQNSPNSGTLLSASQTFPLTGESPRPTLILYFVRSKNTPTTPNFPLRFCTRVRVPNGIARKFPLATGGVSLYNKRQIIFADGRTARFLRCKESYNRCWVNMSECG